MSATLNLDPGVHNNSVPTPNELSKMLIRMTKHELEASACGFKVTNPIVAEHLGVSVSMIKQINAGKKEFGRTTFQRLAECSGVPFEKYVASIMKWHVINGERSDEGQYGSEPRCSGTLPDGVESAFSALEDAFSSIRRELRHRSWRSFQMHGRGCPVEDSRQSFTLIFMALAKFFDLISVRLLKSCAVIFHRDSEGESFGYGLRRNRSSNEWEAPFLNTQEISDRLFRSIAAAWSAEAGDHTWLEARDACEPHGFGEVDNACSFFATGHGKSAEDRILIQPVHEQYHPVAGLRARTDCTRTTLVMRFSFDDSSVVAHVMETIADRTVDIIEYVRLHWIQDLAISRSLTNSALSLSLRTLPSQRTQLTLQECSRRNSLLLQRIRSAAISHQCSSQRKKGAQSSGPLGKMLSKMLACDVWVFDEGIGKFFSHPNGDHSIVLPIAEKTLLVDPDQGRRVTYKEAYERHLVELKPSGLGGKSISCIATQCFLNVQRDFQAGLLKQAVRLLERGNQVAIPVDLVEHGDDGKCVKLSHAVLWVRFDGQHSAAAVKAFVQWVDQQLAQIEGVKIRIGDTGNGSRKHRKLKVAEIDAALNVGMELLNEFHERMLLQD
jgi:hypothetical protein